MTGGPIAGFNPTSNHCSVSGDSASAAQVIGAADEEALVAAAQIRAGRNVHAVQNLISNLHGALALLRDEATPLADRSELLEIAFRAERRIRAFLATGKL